MSDKDKDIVLANQASDYVTMAAKSVLGAVPFAGSLLAEIAGAIIPNQRIDRLGKFAVSLQEQLESLNQDVIRSKLNDENFTDLAEETMRQAARAVTDERRRYLAALLANGLKSDDVSHIESKHLLRILEELNDVEVIWLRFYLNPVLKGDEEFRAKHQEVLRPLSAAMSSPQPELDKYQLQQSYKAHLAQLGLLRPKYETNIRTKEPVFDSFTGGPKLKGYDITGLGRLLLRQIDLANDHKE